MDEWNGKTITVDLVSKAPMFEVKDNTRIVNMVATKPMDVFMARMNCSNDVVPAISSQYLVSAELFDGTDSHNILEPTDEEKDEGNFMDSPEDSSFPIHFEPAHDFVPPFYFDQVNKKSTASAMENSSELSISHITPKVGTTQKHLWVDLTTTYNGNYSAAQNINGREYTRRKAVLRAVGEYCYVWVVEGFFSDTENSTQKISSAKAQELAVKFDQIYPLVRGVFGAEADTMINSGSLGLDFPKIETVSDTGKIVNIVLYDIEGDSGYSYGGGVYGYFWAKDYYTSAYSASAGTKNRAVQLTNQGKYFYVDSYFANADAASIYSTLAHEFQHMINFGNKTMASMKKAGTNGNVLYPKTWYNEMLSMLCEDMMQEKLNLLDSDTPKARLHRFCTSYYSSGVTDWLAGDDVLKSYACSYAFGAYLARNYGGAALVKNMSQNPYVDAESISQALKATGNNLDFTTAFEKYAQALILDADSVHSKAEVSFDKDAPTVVFVNGYDFPMKAIDLFSYNGFSSGGGPVVLSAKKSERITLRPFGFTLHKLGSLEEGEKMTLCFSSPKVTSEKVFILAQQR